MASVIKKKRNFALLLIPAFLVFVVAAPFLVSSSASLHLFLTAVNKRIEGQLSIDSWIIGWQQGMLCKNVSYTDDIRGIRVFIPNLTSNRGLMELLLVPRNLGILQIDSPEIQFSGPALKAHLTDKNRKTFKETDLGENQPFWNSIVADVLLKKGKISATIKDDASAIAFAGVEIDAGLETGVITYDARLHSLEQGRVQLIGSLNMPFHSQDWLETVIAETQFNIDSLQVEDFLKALDLTTLPHGKGILNADFKIKAAGYNDIQFNGLAELQDATFLGGFLDEDQPHLKKIHLAVEEGKWSMAGWRITEAELTSDFLSMKVTGNSSPEQSRIDLKGNVKLPVVFDQLPHLLHVNESLFLERGDIAFSAETKFQPQGWNIELKASLNDIGGFSADERFAWVGPVKFLFEGSKDNEELEVSKLSFDAPFARLEGNGKLDSFAMNGIIDVQQTLSELNYLFQHELTGQGRLEMAAKSKPVDDKEGNISVDLNMNIADFTVNHRGQELIPKHEFSLVAGLQTEKSLVMGKQGELDLQVALSSWLGEFFLVMYGDKQLAGPFKGYYTTDSEVYLGYVSTMLHAADILRKSVRMSGSVQFQAEGFAGQIPLEIRDLTAEFTDFTLEGDQGIFSEPKMLVSMHQPVNDKISFLALRDLQVAESRDSFLRHGQGLNLIDFQNKSLFLHNLTLETAAGVSTIYTLGIPNWREPLVDTWADIDLNLDLKNFTGALHAFEQIPDEITFSGEAQLALDWTKRESPSSKVKLVGDIDDFGMLLNGTRVIDSDTVAFSGTVQGGFPFGNMIVDTLKLDSQTLAIEATGKSDVQDNNQALELTGSIRPDLKTFGKIIANEFDMALQMQGKPREKFTLTYPLWKKLNDAISGLRVITTFHANQLVYNDIELRGLVSPITFENSVLHLDLAGLVKDGRLKFATEIDYGIDPPVMKVPRSSLVLEKVKVNDPLNNELLSRVHPFFGGLTRTSGSLDLRLDSFWWPMKEQRRNEANLVCILGVQGIKLKNDLLFSDILGLVGLENEAIRMLDDEIYCIGKNGRIKCSPVRILAGDAELMLGGSVQLDGSLDYTIELPFTRKIVNEEVYQVLDGTKIEVAIGGTSKKPLFNRDKVLPKIESLKKQAEEEIARKSTGKRESS